MQAREQLDRVRKIVLDAKKLKKRREQLVASGTSLVEIDAEIERNQAEYQEMLDCLTPLINQIGWDQLRNILYKFYFEAAPMSEVLTTVIDLPVNPSCLSFAQSRKQMAIKDLQRVIDRQENKK
jgi:hypothetical protein